MFNVKPMRLVSQKELRGEVKKQVLIACNFYRGVGHPTHSVLGGKAVQMTVDVCTDIVGILVGRMPEKREVLETSIDYLNTPSGRREFAKKIMNELSALRTGDKSPVALERLRSKLGFIIKVNVADSPNSRRKMGVYVATEGAYPMEMRLAWGLRRKAHAKSEAAFSELDHDFSQAMPGLIDGMPFGHSVAEAVTEWQKANSR